VLNISRLSMGVIPAAIMAASCVEASTFKLPELHDNDMLPIVNYVTDRCKTVAQNPRRVIKRLQKSGFGDAEYFEGSSIFFKQVSSQVTSYSTSVAPKGVKASDAQLLADKFGYPLQAFLFINEGLPGKNGNSCGAVLTIGMSEVVDDRSENAIIDGLFSKIKAEFNTQNSLVLDQNLTKSKNHYFVWRQRDDSTIAVSIQRLAPVMSLMFSNEEKN